MPENIPKRPVPTLYGSEEDLGVRYKDVDYPYVPGKGFMKPPPEFEGFPKGPDEAMAVLRSGAFFKSPESPELKALEASLTPREREIYDRRMASRTRPPEGAKGPDYTDRSGFEQQVFRKLGRNPFTVDVMAEVNKAYTQGFPA
ncbi:unnamed protein product, partial [marine sediment metagenome]